MLNSFRNHVRIAVDRIGGPTKTAHELGVSNTTIHAWINRSHVPNIDKARLMARLSGLDVQDLRSVL